MDADFLILKGGIAKEGGSKIRGGDSMFHGLAQEMIS